MKCQVCQEKVDRLIYVETGVIIRYEYKDGYYEKVDESGGMDESWFECPACGAVLANTVDEADLLLNGGKNIIWKVNL